MVESEEWQKGDMLPFAENVANLPRPDFVKNKKTGEVHIREKQEIITTDYMPATFSEYRDFIEKEKEEKALKLRQKTLLKEIKKEQEEEEDCIRTSFIKEGNIIAEQIYDGANSGFIVYDNDKQTFSDSMVVELSGIKYKANLGEEITKHAIWLPTDIKEYIDDENLDRIIKAFIVKWLDIPDKFLTFALWNIKKSWVYDKFHTLNYLRALGDTGQGKSRFLDTLGALHYKPIFTSGATTAAPIFRMIEKWRGTLVIDEADLKHSDEKNDIIKIINQGYEKGKWIMRCDESDYNNIKVFDPFCPKLLATRKPFEDKATESRCMTQVMCGTKRRDIPPNLNESFMKEAEEIRNMLLLWRFRNYFKINPPEDITQMLDLDLEPRVIQIVNCFFGLFANDKTQLESFKEYILEYQDNLIDERRDSTEGVIIESIANLINDAGMTPLGEIYITSQDIIERGQILDFRGKLMNPRGITRYLKSLGFEKNKIIKHENETKRIINLNKEHLFTLFKRYGVTVVTVLQEDPPTATQKKLMNNNSIPVYPPENSLRLIKDRNNSNYVTKTVENSDKNNNLILHKNTNEFDKIEEIKLNFDEKLICYQKCAVENCNETECNFDVYNVPYCRKHWELMAQ